MEETREDTFQQSLVLPFISPSFPRAQELVTTAPENFVYPWDVQTSMLPLPRVGNVFQVMFQIKQLFKNMIERSAPRQDSSAWQGVWDGLGRCLERWAPPGVWNFIFKQLQNPEKVVESLGKVCCGPANPKEAQITAACQGLAHTC